MNYLKVKGVRLKLKSLKVTGTQRPARKGSCVFYGREGDKGEGFVVVKGVGLEITQDDRCQYLYL